MYPVRQTRQRSQNILIDPFSRVSIWSGAAKHRRQLFTQSCFTLPREVWRFTFLNQTNQTSCSEFDQHFSSVLRGRNFHVWPYSDGGGDDDAVDDARVWCVWVDGNWYLCSARSVDRPVVEVMVRVPWAMPCPAYTRRTPTIMINLMSSWNRFKHTR